MLYRPDLAFGPSRVNPACAPLAKPQDGNDHPLSGASADPDRPSSLASAMRRHEASVDSAASWRALWVFGKDRCAEGVGMERTADNQLAVPSMQYEKCPAWLLVRIRLKPR